jgi:methylmalonyl-CoA/ethylmalonyl-CoA epimerase
MLKNVHHINLLVSDLDAAVQRYRQTLGITEMLYGALSQRGVRTARFLVGQTWIVLVQPTDPEGVPGRHLEEHGEGLFLLSLEVESLSAAVAAIKARGGKFSSELPRRGLEDWQVVDLDPGQFFGAQLQLAEQAAPPEG